MGIQGLHKGLTFATRKTSLRDFRRKVLAVDASSWLHRSVYSVSEKYVEGIEGGHIDPSCIRVSSNYISSRCKELLGVFEIGKIFLVMDGKRCPLKADTNGDRERRRQENLKEARKFKSMGRHNRAEEKYKTCIKIKDDFTIAVMKEVKKSFSGDRRVQFVWSPYEADAQLAKLCVDRVADAVITEDSDVLVYSASCHCAFPVIYKLDRRSGSCDVISMDWLLSYTEEPSATSKKSTSAIETLFKNLASRQARRPGFGVRLFVQGCVLAGCDYAPNKLTGVGLVNAFKYVRDNAFREDSVRFAKLLDAIPRKHRANLNITEYELTLSKSEAVFYYHLVRHQDGGVKPLCETRRSGAENGPTPHFTDHFPFMERYEDDWGFLGETKEPSACKASNSTDGPPLTEIIIGGPKSKRAGQAKMPESCSISNRKRSSKQNPYLKTQSSSKDKRPRSEEGPSSAHTFTRTSSTSSSFSNGTRNPFSHFAKDSAQESHVKSGGKLFSKSTTTMDPRFVKRDFRPKKEINQQRMSSSQWFNRRSQTAGENCPPSSSNENGQKKEQMLPSTITDLATSPPMKPSQTELPSFFDLTDSNSNPEPLNLDGIAEDEIIDSPNPARVSLESSVVETSLIGTTSVEETHGAIGSEPIYDFNLPEASTEPLLANLQEPISVNNVPYQSKENTNQYSRFFARREQSPNDDDVSEYPLSLLQNKRDSETHQANEACCLNEEIIGSPGNAPLRQKSPNLVESNMGSTKSFPPLASKHRPRAGFRRKPSSGPLVSAFARQRNSNNCTSAIQGRSWIRSFGPLKQQARGRKSRTSMLTSYFPAVNKKSECERHAEGAKRV